MGLTGYGDSSHTADGKYIIASFRADANLGWVVDLRSFLNISELKYKHYAPLEKRNHVAANRPLYRNVMNGLSEAELTIIDRERYSWKAYFRYTDKCMVRRATARVSLGERQVCANVFGL